MLRPARLRRRTDGEAADSRTPAPRSRRAGRSALGRRACQCARAGASMLSPMWHDAFANEGDVAHARRVGRAQTPMAKWTRAAIPHRPAKLLGDEAVDDPRLAVATAGLPYRTHAGPRHRIVRKIARRKRRRHGRRARFGLQRIRRLLMSRLRHNACAALPHRGVGNQRVDRSSLERPQIRRAVLARLCSEESRGRHHGLQRIDHRQQHLLLRACPVRLRHHDHRRLRSTAATPV